MSDRSDALGVKICAVSSVVEHYIDTVGVTGSNPVSRTIFLTSQAPGEKSVASPRSFQAVSSDSEVASFFAKIVVA